MLLCVLITCYSVDSAWFQRLKQNNDTLVSKFAFNCNLRPYTTGDVLAPSMISGGGDRWNAGARIVIADDMAFTDNNGCISFEIILTDLAGHVAAPVTAIVGWA